MSRAKGARGAAPRPASRGGAAPNAARPPKSGGQGAASASRRRVWLLAVLGLVIVVGLAALLMQRQSTGGGPRALILDQLDLTHPNPAFVAAATEILTQAGYRVDYIPGREVTVDTYRGLAERDDDLIILRSHSARRAESEDALADDVTLFTAERFTWDRHADAIRGKRVGAVYNEFEQAIATHEAAYWASAEPPVTPTPDSGETFEGQKLFFGVRGAFIEQDMRGRFTRRPTVILMGCDGLRSPRLARAFAARGAGDFISWDQPVSPERTDAATETLLRHLLIDRLPVAEAVARTMEAVGEDAVHGSTLGYLAAGG